MPGELNQASVGQTGSVGNLSTSPAGGSAGELGNSTSGVDFRTQYEELEKKFGTQGQELGELRTFFKSVEPLLEKLDSSPDMIKAILDGKIDSNLAKAALEGKVKVEDAAIVSAAHDQVKKDLGSKKYESASPEDVEKLVEQKAASIKEELTRTLEEKDELRAFEEKTAYFIANTQDFERYAADVNQWLLDHPSEDDIETAYFAVKGKALAKAMEEGDMSAIAELRKEMALNAGGGGSQGGSVTVNPNVVDSLIAPISDPNRL